LPHAAFWPPVSSFTGPVLRAVDVNTKALPLSSREGLRRQVSENDVGTACGVAGSLRSRCTTPVVASIRAATAALMTYLRWSQPVPMTRGTTR
jgi:hypothetical protein